MTVRTGQPVRQDPAYRPAVTIKRPPGVTQGVVLCLASATVKHTPLALIVLSACGLTACGPTVATNPPRNPPPAPASEHKAPAPFVPPRYAVGRGAYEMTSTATIQFVGDSSTKPDTLQTAVVVRYDASWTGSGLDFTGTVQSRVTAASTRLREASTESLDPVPFRATVDTARGVVQLIGDSAESACPSAHAGALASARQYLASVPRTLAPGTSWTDTTVATNCRGEIPVTTTAIRHFTVALEHLPSGPPVIVVSHLSTIALQGENAHRARGVTLTGAGTRQYEDRYDAFTGVLKSRAAVIDIDLSIGVAGAPTRLHEHVDEHAVPIVP